MSVPIPARRIGQSALAVLRSSPTYWTCAHQIPLRTRRTLTTTPQPRAEKAEKDLSNPLLESYLEKQQRKDASSQPAARPQLRTGYLSPNSLFSSDIDTAVPKPNNPTPKALAQWEAERRARRREEAAAHEHKLSSLKLDPDPRGRRNWERKMVITSLRKRGRLTKAMKLAREERESHYKSQFLPTSIKKLTQVMNQVAGKTVEEALVQLRFSKKKVARDVWKGLKMARDEAIVARGMGLGKGQHMTRREARRAKQEEADVEKANPKDLQNADRSTKLTPTEHLELVLPDGMRRASKTGHAAVIELKDGRSKRIHDPTEMYVDQAWVGRGTPGKSIEHRARGQRNILQHRSTCFSVILKEEKTRMRISDEIKKKRASRKLWVALPDRPVIAQRQYCLW